MKDLYNQFRAMEHGVESLCYELLDQRKGGKFDKTRGKRKNTKEVKEREVAMKNRDEQRLSNQAQKQLAREKEHLEELNRLNDRNYLKRLKAQQSDSLTPGEAKARLYIETMMSDAIGKLYTGLSAKKREEQNRRIEEMRRSLLSR